jgi:molybdopterin converting factor small subunit
MGKIGVSYTYRLRDITGKSYESLEIKTPTSIHDLISHLKCKYGYKFDEEIDLEASAIGEKSSFYLTFVDGNRIPDTEKFDPRIRNESEVTFLTTMGGG